MQGKPELRAVCTNLLDYLVLQKPVDKFCGVSTISVQGKLELRAVCTNLLDYLVLQKPVED